MKPLTGLLSLVAAACLIAGPATASAQDYCVNSPPGCSGVGETDLQTALDDAKANAGPDRVLLAPGTYTQTDGFKYQTPTAANTVDISGVGTPLPTVTMITSGSQNSALIVDQPGSVVENLTITVPDAVSSEYGLSLYAGATGQNLTVTGPSPAANLQTGVFVSGSTLRNSLVDMGASGVGIYAVTNSPALIAGNTIRASRGLDVVSVGTALHIARDKISAAYKGIYVYTGAPQVDNTLIDMRGGDVGVSYGIQAVTTPSGTTTNVSARQLTIRNGNANTYGVDIWAGNNGSHVTVDLRDSIIRDVGHAVQLEALPDPTSTYTFIGDHDDYDRTTNLPVSPGAGQTFTETNIVNVDPHFVSPISGADGLSGDYRLASGSPLIDAGSSTPLGAGETDLAGMPRIVDGVAQCSTPVRDLGAYEYQGACTSPTPPASETPLTGQQAAALKKCKKIRNKVKRRKCKKRARRLPL